MNKKSAAKSVKEKTTAKTSSKPIASKGSKKAAETKESKKLSATKTKVAAAKGRSANPKPVAKVSKKATAVATTVLDIKKLKSKGLKRRKLDFASERPPMEATGSRATLSKAKDIGELSKGLTWSKVMLNAQKTSGNFAKLNLTNVLSFSAESNWITLVSTSNTWAEASVAYKALKAGDNFLVRFFIDVISNGSQFQLSTFGGSAPVSMTLNAGPHEIPVVAVAQIAGDHSVQLLLTMPNRGFYLQGIEIQPLSE
jgi:hypothetical protein